MQRLLYKYTSAETFETKCASMCWNKTADKVSWLMMCTYLERGPNLKLVFYKNAQFFHRVEPLGDADEERYRMLCISQIWPLVEYPYLETPSPPRAPPPEFGLQKAFWMETIAGCALLLHFLKLAVSLWIEEHVYVSARTLSCFWKCHSCY